MTSGGESRTVRQRLRAQVGHEPVAVAPVDRVDELHDLAALGARDPLEQERRRVQRDAQRLRLLLVGDRRLDRLHAARDHDPVAGAEQVVKRLALEIGGAQAGNERVADVQRLDRHRLAVGQPEALGDDDRLRRRDVQEAPEPCAGRDDLEPERLAPRVHAATAHVLREGGHGQLLGDLRLAYERSRAATANEVALARELVQRGSHRQPRDTEVDAELALRRDRLTDAEAVDQVEDPVAGLGLLGHVATGARRGSGAVSGSSVLPLSGSKKCSRAGSSASSSGSPTWTLARGSTRALNSALDSATSVVSSRPLTSVATASASIWKKTCASEPSSSTTSGTTVNVGAPGAAKATAPNASGRTPTMAFRCPPGGRRAPSSGIRKPPKTTSSPSMAPSTRFIAGVPMKAATKTFAG